MYVGVRVDRGATAQERDRVIGLAKLALGDGMRAMEDHQGETVEEFDGEQSRTYQRPKMTSRDLTQDDIDYIFIRGRRS
jgi:hypothetical protein